MSSDCNPNIVGPSHAHQDVSGPNGIYFEVPGIPRGKGRHRTRVHGGRPQQYTDDQTKAYEQEIQHAWMVAGRKHLGDGPLDAQIGAVHERPRDHFRVNGGLTAKGLREWVPIVKPDGDNCCKVVLDALNGLAYRDDAQIVGMVFERRWAEPGASAHIEVGIRVRLPPGTWAPKTAGRAGGLTSPA
jgi:Holliday junction resolvase RusA-like endonuclease